jgi:hypothetical protein
VQKTIIGDWGSELDDGGYACALAALGVLESRSAYRHRSSSDPLQLASALREEFAFGERTPVWRGAYYAGPHLFPTVAYWRETAHEDAAVLAEAWWRYRGTIQHERQTPRLGIPLSWRNHSALFDFDALYAWLTHEEVGLDSLVLADEPMDRFSGAWHWPLRVGVPLGTEEWIHAALQTAQGQSHWVESLSRYYTVGESHDSCDLLILTKSAAEEILDRSRTRIRARFVVCLDKPQLFPSAIHESYSELSYRLHAAGLSLIGYLDFHQLVDWFTAVLAVLSHDVPIHAAVSYAGRGILGGNPLTIGSPWALDQCRVLALAKRQDEIAERLSFNREAYGSRAEKPFFYDEEPTFGGVPSPSPAPPPPLPDSLRKRLADDLRDRMFTSESEDGVLAAEALIRREDDIELVREPRWIQVNAWRPDAPRRRAPSLAPSQWNLLTVHIGPTEQRRFDAPFPERSVDFSHGDVDVTVQLELDGTDLLTIDPAIVNADALSSSREGERLMAHFLHEVSQIAHAEESTAPVAVVTSKIILPPAGSSTLAPFAVRPKKNVTQIGGRVAIIHNNRILQTAHLSITTEHSPDEGNGLDVVAEAPIHPRYDDLEERREYDVAILVSDIGGKLHLTIQHDGVVTPVQLDDLDSPISDLRKALEAASVNWDHAKPMFEQETFPDNLYALAASGSALEQHLRKRCGDAMNDWNRIHVVPATNEFLPLEYVYDGPPPRDDATVCPNILGALERESCDKALTTPAGVAACPNQKDDAFVCPMHFWGFKKLIERSGTIQPAPASGATELATVCVPSKQAYGKLRGMLFAASDRAFLFEADPQARQAARAALIKELGEISTISDAADWEKWREKVKTNPNLLVLVVHAQKHRGVRSLEIGDKRFLGYQQINRDLSGGAGRPQLLVLLGCSVADVTEDFQPYPQRFRDAGVSIVLAPIATIRGADAVPIARRITQVLAERLARPEPTTFGELLPLLRRELLRKGHPGVMGIVGFGDGDWLLGGA